MTERFKPGDVVQLKSGGPRMTVTRPKRDTANGSVIGNIAVNVMPK